MLKWLLSKTGPISSVRGPSKSIEAPSPLSVKNRAPAGQTLTPVIIINKPPKPCEKNCYKPYNIVMSGGSLKGVSFIGCVKFLEETDSVGYAVNLVGTSFGSLVLFMLALGYSSDEMIDNLVSCIGENSPDRKEDTKKKPLAIKAILKCLERGGMDNGSIVLECIKRPLIRKFERSDITFIELAKMTGKNLVVTGSNLTKTRCEFFSVDTTPNMSVVLALRISTSIPLIFDPIIHEGSVYVDGALFNNFAIEYVLGSTNRGSHGETLGIIMEDDDLHDQLSPQQPCVDIGSLLPLFLKAVLSRLNSDSSQKSKEASSHANVVIVRVLSSEMKIRVPIKSLSFSLESLAFSMSRSDAIAIVQYGYEASKDAFSKHRVFEKSACGEGKCGRYDDAPSDVNPARVLLPEDDATIINGDGDCEDHDKPHDEQCQVPEDVFGEKKDEQLADAILASYEWELDENCVRDKDVQE